MIHTVIVDHQLSIAQLKKALRKAAMTGGVEIEVNQNLSVNEVEHLLHMHVAELVKYDPDTSNYRSNSSYRVLQSLNNLYKLAPDAQAMLTLALSGERSRNNS